MRISSHKLSSLIAVFLIAISTNIVSASSAVSDCDLTAAHPDDPSKVTTGVSWDELSVDVALKACEAAITIKPNNARIQFQYARTLDKQQSYEKAFDYYQKAAKQGHMLAQNSLGMAYEWGQGTNIDMDKALFWYTKAARKGNAQAQNSLGAMYDLGKAVDPDEKKAIQWFRKAAQQGDATAQRNLGIMYSRGQGVKQNDKLAFEWYLKAANQNHASAQYYVGVSYYYGKGVSTDPEQAREWFEKAAQNGNYEAKQVMYQIQFKQRYCDSMKSKVGVNSGYNKLTSQKFLGKRECDG